MSACQHARLAYPQTSSCTYSLETHRHWELSPPYFVPQLAMRTMVNKVELEILLLQW